MNFFKVGAIISLFGWISLFPQPIQADYHLAFKFFLIVFFIFLLIEKKDIKSIFSKKDWPLWLFLVSMLGGIIHADNKQLATRTYFDIALILFFVYYLARELFSSKKYAFIIIKTICIFSIVVALFGVFELVFRKNPIYEYLIYNPFYQRYINWPIIPRLMSTQFHPPILGSYLLACLPFGILLAKQKNLISRRLGIVSVILGMIVIILTFSRGAFLGLIFFILFYFWKTKKITHFILFVLILTLVITLCSQITIRYEEDYIPVPFRFGFKSLIYGSHASIFSEYRYQRLIMTLQMVRDYPFFGVGLMQFREKFDYYYTGPYKVPYEFKIADNMYLTILAETGIIGFIGFCIFIFSLLKAGLKKLQIEQDKQRRNMTLVAMCGLIGLLVNMGGYELFYWHSPYILFCFLCGILAVKRDFIKI